MKKIQNILTATALVPVMLFSSCSNDFLKRTPETALDTELVMNDPDLLPSTVVGTMGVLTSAAFNGRDLTVIGDLTTDLVTTAIRSSNGTLRDFDEWNINTNSTDVAGLYTQGHGAAAYAARTIEAALRLIQDSASLEDGQLTNLYNALATSYTIKVYAEYIMTQYFCVDVNYEGRIGNNARRVGLMLLVNKALANTDPANMSTLEDTYRFMEYELGQALHYYERSQNTTTLSASDPRFYPSKAAAYLLQARVALAQGRSNPAKFSEALTAVENAFSCLGDVGANQELISDQDGLLAAYGTSPSTEDIWLLNYTSQDNLSANSLANLFGAYGFNASEYATGLFHTADIRKALYYGENAMDEDHDSRCLKYPNDDGVFNVPVFRVPELYLIKAEAAAWNGDLSTAQEALFAVIGARDTSIGSIEDMMSSYRPSDINTNPDVNNGQPVGILNVIMEERAREFLCEGHRWFDLRRNGLSLTREGDLANQQYSFHFQNYPIYAFAFPIPFSETNTNQWKNGRGIVSYNSDWTINQMDNSNRNWQNNAWDQLDGTTYSATVGLPANFSDATPHDWNNQNPR